MLNTVGGLNRYKCHKEVMAAKITSILNSGCEPYVLSLEGGGTRNVSHTYMLKHNPQVGGYYVLYDDGYESWSPAKAFEDGYSLMTAILNPKG